MQNMVNPIVEGLQGNISDELILISKNFFQISSKELKKYKKDWKSKGIGLYVIDSKLFSYFQLQNLVIDKLITIERERAWDFLNDKEQQEKYNFINELDYKVGGKYWDNEAQKPTQKMPKQTLEQQLEWAEQAFPKITIEEWEKEFNILLMSQAN